VKLSADAALVRELRQGRAAAFDLVYERYHKRILNFLSRLSGNRALAEDLYQETWLKLARNVGSLHEDSDLGAWLFTVARNQYLSHRRARSVDRARLSLVSPEPTASPETQASARASLAAVELALARLSCEDRELLLLCGVEALTPAQAATILGISAEATRQRLLRARTRLRTELAAQAQARLKGAAS
jgi:RNA polymerase sigma-70 factor (ECF subfamily)